MRKIFILVGIMVISLVLVGCTGGSEVKTPPSFTGIKIEDTNPVDGTEFVVFYKPKQETVRVEIGLDNPDSLTIKSVVINGVTYNSHRFLEGSTFATVYFDMNVGSVLGETLYSVDRISYLEGENTKTVEGFQNHEFTIYVYKDLPSVERDNYTLQRDAISIDFTVIDTDNVINLSTLRAEIWNGSQLVESKPMIKGTNTVLFDDTILSNKSYEVKVVASYDIDDSNGELKDITLYSENYLTLSNTAPSATIVDENVSSNSVSFTVDFVDEDGVITTDKLRAVIYNGDTLLSDSKYTKVITSEDRFVEFDDLLNDNEYTVKILADYDLLNGEGELTERPLATYTFTTLPRSAPVPDIVDLNLKENSIEFGIAIEDPYNVISEDTLLVQLFVDDEFVDEAELFVDDSYTNLYDIDYYSVELFISELFADSIIRIEITADCDFNDGNGPINRPLGEPIEYTTSINQIPNVSVETLVVTQGYVSLNFIARDPNETMNEPFKIHLYEEGVLVDSNEFTVNDEEFVFEYETKSERNYHIEITGTYDLRDGQLRRVDKILNTLYFYSKEDKAPVAEIRNEVLTDESITFTVYVMDADETLVDAVDPDVNKIMKAVLYEVGNPVPVATSANLLVGSQTVVFDTNIKSNTQYEVRIEATYELQIKDDEAGNPVIDRIEDDPINVETYFTTLAKEDPTAEVTDSTIGNQSIALEVDIIDDGVIVEGTLYAVIVYNNVERDDQDPMTQLHPIPLNIASDQSFTFSNLYAEEQYTIRIIADLNYNDGRDTIEHQVIMEEIYTTAAYEPTNVVVSETRVTDTTIEIDYQTSGSNSINVGNFEAVAYEAGRDLSEYTPVSVAVSLNATATAVLEGLNPSTEYYVVIEASIDLKTEDGVMDDYELFAEFLTTEQSPAPTENLVSFTTETVDKTTASFDILIDDDEDYLTSFITATLTQYNNETVATFIIAPTGITTVDLNDLLSNNDYTLTLTTTYDQGNGDELFEYVYEFTTIAKEAPVATINDTENWIFNPTTLDIEVSVTEDIDDVANDTGWEAVLYEDGVVVATVDLDAVNGGNFEDVTDVSVQFTGFTYDANASYTVVIEAALQMNELDALDDNYEVETDTNVGSRTFISAGN